MVHTLTNDFFGTEWLINKSFLQILEVGRLRPHGGAGTFGLVQGKLWLLVCIYAFVLLPGKDDMF